MINQHDNIDVMHAVEAFWLGLEKALRAGGHRFKRGHSSHTLNGASVEIDITDILTRSMGYTRARAWTGKLQIRVSDGRYRGQPPKSWRTSTGGWKFDEIAAHAVECAARNGRGETARLLREARRAETEADPRLQRILARARKLGAQLDLREDGHLVFTTQPMTLDVAVKLLSQTRGNTLDVLIGEDGEET
jgi:hypothetical protein